MLTYTRV